MRLFQRFLSGGNRCRIKRGLRPRRFQVDAQLHRLRLGTLAIRAERGGLSEFRLGLRQKGLELLPLVFERTDLLRLLLLRLFAGTRGQRLRGGPRRERLRDIGAQRVRLMLRRFHFAVQPLNFAVLLRERIADALALRFEPVVDRRLEVLRRHPAGFPCGNRLRQQLLHGDNARRSRDFPGARQLGNRIGMERTDYAAIRKDDERVHLQHCPFARRTPRLAVIRQTIIRENTPFPRPRQQARLTGWTKFLAVDGGTNPPFYGRCGFARIRHE